MWLERTYFKNKALSEIDISHIFSLKPTDKFDDFDAKKKFGEINFINGEKRIYQTIIEHLRAGEVYGIQEKLLHSNCYE